MWGENQKEKLSVNKQLSCVSKVYERLLGDQLNDHFISRNNILCNVLSGFRKGYSTQHALQVVIETLRRSLDSKGIVGTILMDLNVKGI